jgi:hypothetical protein
MDLKTPATVDTPRRYIRTLIDAANGYDGDLKEVAVSLAVPCPVT